MIEKIIDWIKKSVLERLEVRLGTEYYAYFLGLFSNFMTYVCMQVMKSKGINFSYAGLLRGMGFVLLNALISHRYGDKAYEIDSKSNKLLILRSALMAFQQFFFQYAITVIPIYQGMVIQNMSPIMLYILNYLFFGIKIPGFKIKYILICFVGVALSNCSKQILLFLQDQPEENVLESEDVSLLHLRILVSVLLLASTALFALAIILIKKIKTSVVMLNIQVGIAFYVISGTYYLQHDLPPQQEYFQSDNNTIFDNIVNFFLFGLPFAVSILAFNYASQIVKNIGNLGLTAFSSVVFSFLFQVFCQGAVPNLIEITGLILVLIGIIKVL